MGLVLFGVIIAHLLFDAAQAARLLPEHLTQVTTETVVSLGADVQPENLILRRNNHLLVTSASIPRLMQIDPFAGPNQTARIVARFAGYASTTGIVELEPDLFALGVGNYSGSAPPHGTPGTWNVYVVNLTGYIWPSFDPSRVQIEQQIALPQISDIDGLALINSRKGLLAAADFTAGVVWLINVHTGGSSLLAGDPQLAPATPYDPANPLAVNGTDPAASIGANGLKYKDQALYFTNFAKGLYGTIPIDPDTGAATGSVETAFAYGTHLDDLALSKAGNVYLTTYDTPGLGVIRRKSGTPAGSNGTDLLVPIAGANAVLLHETAKGCTLYICKALAPYSIVGALVGGVC